MNTNLLKRACISMGLWLLVLQSCQATTYAARDHALVHSELQQLAGAICEHQHNYNSFPPCISSSDNHKEIRDYIGRVMLGTGRSPRVFDKVDFSLLDQSEALVFYLSGLSIKKAKTAGEVSQLAPAFSAGAFANAPELYCFEPERLRDHDLDGFWEYVPADSDTPYVYFDSPNYDSSCQSTMLTDYAVPYKQNDGTYWLPDQFQIIAAGSDCLFGGTPNRYWPSEKGFTHADYDNITNFSDQSFEFMRLSSAVSSGRGQFIKLITFAVALLIPVAIVMSARCRPRRICLWRLMLVYTAITLLIAVVAWEARQLGLTVVAPWFMREVAGVALCIGWMATAVLIPNMPEWPSTRPLLKWSLVSAIPFCIVWYGSWVNSNIGHVGWPFPYRQLDILSVPFNLIAGMLVAATLIGLRWSLSPNRRQEHTPA